MRIDYHLANVERITRKGTSPQYQATCSCSWRGAVRNSKYAAEEDATAHDIAENEDDTEEEDT